MVEIVSSNRILKNGSIEYQMKKPFDLLAKANEPKGFSNWCTLVSAYRTFLTQQSALEFNEIKKLAVA